MTEMILISLIVRQLVRSNALTLQKATITIIGFISVVNAL